VGSREGHENDSPDRRRELKILTAHITRIPEAVPPLDRAVRQSLLKLLDARVLRLCSGEIVNNGRTSPRQKHRDAEMSGIQAVKYALAVRHDPDLFERIMGFPADPPDLGALKPPAGNTRPGGVTASHFERRARGELPRTY
jgi:hypothetical protein